LSVTALQGPRPGPELTGGVHRAKTGPARRRPPPGDEPLLHPVVARIVALLALVAFGAVHWMLQLEPAAGFRVRYAIGIAIVTVLALLGAARLRGWWRYAALAGTVAGGLALAFLAGGAHDEQLLLRNWGGLGREISHGLDALPGARIPYRGLDEQLQLIIPLGGTILTFVATALAMWPRRGGRFGYTGPALIALVTLYAVPAVSLILGAEFLRGLLLALLVIAFLRLERLRRRDAPAAAAVIGVVGVLALIAAPALDKTDPWWNYEDWAQTAAGARSTTFSWDHDYAVLAWPRDGRELLRIRSTQRAYWKADQLDLFDGREWTRDRTFTGHEAPSAQYAGVDLRRLADWSFRIKVTVRNLRSFTLPVAGSAEDVDLPGRPALQVRPGIFTVGRPIRRGDAYTADVYLPQPSADDLQQAGTAYSYDLERYTSLVARPTSGPYAGRDMRLFADGFFGVEPTLIEGVDESAIPVLEASTLRRAYGLSRQLLGGASTPYEYVKAVERYLDDGFTYSEAPPDASRTLDGFLFRSKAGFCQQFSGAMALLLRLGGIPARVATGFGPGSYDKKAKEYVVRDLDAHSWVEAWFPGIGWVTFDPTPAAAPPRSQALINAPSAARGDLRDIGTTQADPTAISAPADGPRPWARYALGLLTLAGLGLAGRALLRRRGRPRPLPVSELEAALRGAGERLPPGVTLRALEARFRASPGATAYLAALREQRYAPTAGSGPTPAQRRGLRRALGRGRGPRARARTWLALRPRLRPHRGLH
jgi:transglutaminase-like putative cysteine protease